MKLSIVFLSDDFPPRSFGGAGISTFELALEMKKRGHEVFVVTTCRERKEEGESEYRGLKVFTLSTNYPERWRAYIGLNNSQIIPRLEKILREIRPDVVHANNIHQYLSYKSLKIAQKYARRVIWTARDVMAFSYGKLSTSNYLEKLDSRVTWVDNLRSAGKRWNPFRNLIIKNYLQYVDRKVAISHSLQKALLSNGIKDVEVIHNGIDAEEWSQIGGVEEFKKKHNLLGKKVILFGGRLSPAKGGEKAVEALSKVVKEIPEAVLLCVGAVDEYARQMQQKARMLGVERNLINIGWLDREEVKKAYGVADVVLMASICLDTFGRVNIEAMAVGKAVVGTCYGGTPEIVEDGKTGYIVNPQKFEEMALKIIELLNNPEKARAFGEAGLKRVKEEFNIAEKADQYLKLYASA